LRAWEKRYGVVYPSRTEGGQRLYSDEDVLRLALLHKAVEAGRSISQVATLSLEELTELVREDEVEGRALGSAEPLGKALPGRELEKAIRAVKEMDSPELERILTRAAMAFPVSTVVDDVVSPLLSTIGSAWVAGKVGPAHEHLATVTIRRFLEWMLGNVSVGDVSPVLVAGTPSGERHELGALLAALSGAAEGWRSIYLGPDLPAEEIVAAAIRLEAEVVALSCVDPRNVEALPKEIQAIRERLPADVHLVLGGGETLEDPRLRSLGGVEVLNDLKSLRESLRELGSQS
jgi:methanogenic corrinoid protein MtbC1